MDHSFQVSGLILWLTHCDRPAKMHEGNYTGSPCLGDSVAESREFFSSLEPHGSCLTRKTGSHLRVVCVKRGTRHMHLAFSFLSSLGIFSLLTLCSSPPGRLLQEGVSFARCRFLQVLESKTF